jgi:hypothetical protein
MYSTSGFTGFMPSYSPIVDKDGQHMFKIVFKHESSSPLQSFTKSLDKVCDIPGKFSYSFADPIIWSSIEFNDVSMESLIVIDDEVEFNGKLDKIKCVQKENDDGVTFTYTLTVLKEVGTDNEDARIMSSYMKVKDEDEDGKMKPRPLIVTFTRVDDY